MGILFLSALFFVSLKKKLLMLVTAIYILQQWPFLIRAVKMYQRPAILVATCLVLLATVKSDSIREVHNAGLKIGTSMVASATKTSTLAAKNSSPLVAYLTTSFLKKKKVNK